MFHSCLIPKIYGGTVTRTSEVDVDDRKTNWWESKTISWGTIYGTVSLFQNFRSCRNTDSGTEFVGTGVMAGIFQQFCCPTNKLSDNSGNVRHRLGAHSLGLRTSGPQYILVLNQNFFKSISRRNRTWRWLRRDTLGDKKNCRIYFLVKLCLQPYHAQQHVCLHLPLSSLQVSLVLCPSSLGACN